MTIPVILSHDERLVAVALAERVGDLDYSLLVRLLLDGPKLVMSKEISDFNSGSLSGAVRNRIVVDLTPEKHNRKTYELAPEFIERVRCVVSSISKTNPNFTALSPWPSADGPSFYHVHRRETQFLCETFRLRESTVERLRDAQFIKLKTRYETPRTDLYDKLRDGRRFIYVLKPDAIAIRNEMITAVVPQRQNWTNEWEEMEAERVRKLELANLRRRETRAVTVVVRMPAKERYNAYLEGTISKLSALGFDEEIQSVAKRAKQSEILHRMERLGLTQNQMVDLLGYSKQHILKFRSNRSVAWLNSEFSGLERLPLENPKSLKARGLKLIVDALVQAIAKSAPAKAPDHE